MAKTGDITVKVTGDATVLQRALRDLQHRFAYHAPTGDKVERHARMRNACLEAARVITADTKPSREQSLAITKLEEAMMWANAAIAREREEADGA